MKITHNFKIYDFVLVVTLGTNLGFISPASAYSSYIVDLNSKKVTDIGSLDSASREYTYAQGINAVGQVVGVFETGSGKHAFITGPNGVGMTDLGTLGGNRSEARGINVAGQVVGYSDMPDGAQHAFITGPNGVGMTDLGTLGGRNSDAYGINNDGQVVGSSDRLDGTTHAFITGAHGVGMTDLGTLSGAPSSGPNYHGPYYHYIPYSTAHGINNAGQVAGESSKPDGESHAFITGLNGVGMTDLGRQGGDGYVEAKGINDAGQLVGDYHYYTRDGTGTYASFIFGPNGRTDIRAPGGGYTIPHGINDAGQVVGYFDLPDGGIGHAFVTGPNGMGMIDLNSIANLPGGFILVFATGINNVGQVVANGESISLVPKPSSHTLILIGLALLGFIVSRTQQFRGQK